MACWSRGSDCHCSPGNDLCTARVTGSCSCFTSRKHNLRRSPGRSPARGGPYTPDRVAPVRRQPQSPSQRSHPSRHSPREPRRSRRQEGGAHEGGGGGLGGADDRRERGAGPGVRLHGRPPPARSTTTASRRAHRSRRVAPRGPPGGARGARPRPRRGRAPRRRRAAVRGPRRAVRPLRARRMWFACRAAGTVLLYATTVFGGCGPSTRQDGKEEFLMVRHHTRELPVFASRRAARPARTRRSPGLRPFPHAVLTGPHHAGHLDPGPFPRGSRETRAGIVTVANPDRFTRTHSPSPVRSEESYFTHSQQLCPARPLGDAGSRRIRRAPVPSQTPRAASARLARHPHHG